MLFTPMKSESGTDSFFMLLLPSASSVLGFLYTRCQRLALSMFSREPDPSSTTSSHQSSCVFWKTQIFPDERESHIKLVLLAFSFAPTCLVLVLKSTPRVPTLVSKATLFLLAAFLKPLLQKLAKKCLPCTFLLTSSPSPLPLFSTSSEPSLPSPQNPCSFHS